MPANLSKPARAAADAALGSERRRLLRLAPGLAVAAQRTTPAVTGPLLATAAATATPLAAARAAAATGGPGAAASAGTPAPPPELASAMPTARVQGQGRLRFLGLAVYRIRLWSAEPAEALRRGWTDAPLALEIVYDRAFEGRRIAERSIDEMHRQQPLPRPLAERWHADLLSALPDVDAGDRLTGVQTPGSATTFFANGRRTATVDDPLFTRLFFGIWLSPQTSQPALRAQLLGETAS